MAALGIALSMAAASVRGEMQYRGNFLVMVVMGLVYQLTGFVFIWVVLSRFESIAGWTLGQVAFLYGFRLLVHAIRGVTFGNVGRVESLIRRGQFDRIMVRPIAPLLHVVAMRVPVSDMGNLIGGIGVFAVANAMVGLDWSPVALIYLVLAVIGGCLISAALQLATAALAFRFLNSHALYVLINDITNTFGHYPMTIYGGAMRFFLTFGLPLAFMAYFPATVLLGRTDELSVYPLVAYAAPLVGVVLFALSYLFWHHQIRNYSSAGH